MLRCHYQHGGKDLSMFDSVICILSALHSALSFRRRARLSHNILTSEDLKHAMMKWSCRSR